LKTIGGRLKIFFVGIATELIDRHWLWLVIYAQRQKDSALTLIARLKSWRKGVTLLCNQYDIFMT
jgi:hypothetical protein